MVAWEMFEAVLEEMVAEAEELRDICVDVDYDDAQTAVLLGLASMHGRLSLLRYMIFQSRTSNRAPQDSVIAKIPF